MSYIPPDHRYQIPGYLEGELDRLKERNTRHGITGLPTFALIFVLPFWLVYRAGKLIVRPFRRSGEPQP